jgi:pimeloyl-ACP methyl ester carboxylesterase
MRRFSFLPLVAMASASLALAAESVTYPFPPKEHRFTSQGLTLEMTYMDVAPAGTARGTVMLLHGKNFSGTYFETTAKALREAGYRVIMPDQIGFGRSSKPERYQFSFQQLATNTRGLLQALGITRVHVLGHSMGGMLAARFALMYPDLTASLTLMNPLGLEDWKALGVPYTSLGDAYQAQQKTTRQSLRAYQLESYYDGKWKPEYDRWVDELAALYPAVAWDQALTSDMIYTQPVVYEFPRIKVPTLLIIGQRDRTAIGRNLAPPAIRPTLGNYPALGRAAQKAIAGSELVELEGIGHSPHIEAFDRFIGPYLDFLNRHAGAK